MPAADCNLSGRLDPSGFARFDAALARFAVPQNPTTVVVSAPYPDTSKVGRDGTYEYLVTVRADGRSAVVQFPYETDAHAFREQRIEDILQEAFGS